MKALTENDFLVTYMACKAKAQYEEAMKQRDTLPGLRRVFARRPSDPAKGFSVEQLRKMVNTALKGAYPEFADFYYAADGKPDGLHSVASFLFVGDEPILNLKVEDNIKNRLDYGHYEFRRGYGFVPEFQHGSNAAAETNNRNFAYQMAMSSRLPYDILDSKVYSPFDSFSGIYGFGQHAGRSPFEYLKDKKDVKAVLSKVNRFASDYSAKQQRANLKLDFYANAKIDTLDDYMKAKMMSDSLLAYLKENPERSTAALREKVRGLGALLHSVDDAKLFGMARPHLQGNIRSVSDILDLVKEEFRHESFLNEPNKSPSSFSAFDLSEIYERFVTAATENGFLESQIRNCISSDVVRHGELFKDVQMPNVEELIGNAYNDYHRNLDTYLSSRSPLNLSDLSKSDDFREVVPDSKVAHPYLPDVGYAHRLEESSRRTKVRSWLESEGLGNQTPAELREKADSLGERLAVHGERFAGYDFIDALAGYLHVDKVVVEHGYSVGVGARVRDLLIDSGGHISRIKEKLAEPGVILYNEMANGVERISSEGDLAKLGKFARECGMDLNRKSISECVKAGAAEMYDFGRPEGFKRITAFRNNWHRETGGAYGSDRRGGILLQSDKRSEKENKEKRPLMYSKNHPFHP